MASPMAQVIFYSRGGNTRKVAEAIAAELGTKAESVDDARISKEGSVLFLGSGCYGGKPGPQMLEFIGKSDLSGRKVAVFGTSGGGIGRELDDMEAALRERGALVLGRFSCKGRTFILINWGRPNDSDLSDARKFARSMSDRR